jgi:hypothetical protein
MAFFGVMPAFFAVATNTTSVHFVSGCDKNYKYTPQFLSRISRNPNMAAPQLRRQMK